MTSGQAGGFKPLILTIGLTLTLGLLQWPIGDVSGQKGPSAVQVLQELLIQYGDNTTISVPQLRSLLMQLNGGQNGDHHVQPQPPKTNASKVSPSQDGYKMKHHTGFKAVICTIFLEDKWKSALTQVHKENCLKLTLLPYCCSWR